MCSELIFKIWIFVTLFQMLACYCFLLLESYLFLYPNKYNQTDPMTENYPVHGHQRQLDNLIWNSVCIKFSLSNPCALLYLLWQGPSQHCKNYLYTYYGKLSKKRVCSFVDYKSKCFSPIWLQYLCSDSMNIIYLKEL